MKIDVINDLYFVVLIKSISFNQIKDKVKLVFIYDLMILRFDFIIPLIDPR